MKEIMQKLKRLQKKLGKTDNDFAHYLTLSAEIAHYKYGADSKRFKEALANVKEFDKAQCEYGN
jgi:hypothetical protein